MDEVKMTSSQYKHFFENFRLGLAKDLVQELAKLVPVDTGNLRSSARSSTSRTKDKVSGVVEYLADYAVPVHERTWTILRNGKHKFLEHAVQKSRVFFKRMISEAFTRATKGDS